MAEAKGGLGVTPPGVLRRPGAAGAFDLTAELGAEPWAAGVHPRLSGAAPGTVARKSEVQFRVHALVKNPDDHQLGFCFPVEDNVLLDGMCA